LSAECVSEKQVKNQSIIGEDVDKSKVQRFLTAHSVVTTMELLVCKQYRRVGEITDRADRSWNKFNRPKWSDQLAHVQ